MVLPFLYHKKTSKLQENKNVFSKLKFNLAWHCTGALIFPSLICTLWVKWCHNLHADTSEAFCTKVSPIHSCTLLAGIQPAELRRNGATLSLTRRDMEPGHLLHSALTRLSSANARCLKSRHPFVTAAQQLISSSDNNNIHAAHWADHQWNAEWVNNLTRLRIVIPDTHLPGVTLPRRVWVRLNRFRTGDGRFRSYLYKWGMASSAA